MARSASIVGLAGKLEVAAVSMLGPSLHSHPGQDRLLGLNIIMGCHGRTGAQTGLL